MRANDHAVRGGWDYRPATDTLVGATFGYDRESFAVSSLSTSGKASVYGGGVYAGYAPGAWSLSGSLLYNAAATRQTRYLRVPGKANLNAYGAYDIHALSGRAQLGRTFQAGAVQVQPYGAVEYTRLKLPAYTETDGTSSGNAGAFGLAFAEKQLNRTRTFLGTNVSGQAQLSNQLTLLTTLRGAWVHDFDPARTVRASFANATSEWFETSGAAARKNTGQLDLRAAVRSNRVEFHAGGGVKFGQGYRDLSATAGVRIRM
jgi:outer membrane autotransporter protein